MGAAYSIRISGSASTTIDRASRWWHRHRRASAWLFDVELHKSFDLLEVQPEIGTRATHPLYGEVRIIRLRRTRYVITYQIQPQSQQVWILQVRHASKRPLRGRRASG